MKERECYYYYYLGQIVVVVVVVVVVDDVRLHACDGLVARRVKLLSLSERERAQGQTLSNYDNR